jgi:DNA polymerase-1
MLLQVHDELVFEVQKKEESIVKEIVGREMQQALPLSVPIEVDLGIGKNWLEAH